MKKMDETMDENIALGDSQALEKQTESNILPRVSEIEAKRGREATSAFNNGNFTECLDILKKLLETRHDDHRVQSNMAICQYLIK
jgi:Flp pilus assembly protein TadD